MTNERDPVPTRLKLSAVVAADFPTAAEILVSFRDDWELVDKLKREESPLYIAALPPSPERPYRSHFYGLPPDINLSLTSYRMYKLFQPWPIPSVIVGWDETSGTGRVLKLGDLKVQLQPLGQAQAWAGPSAAVLYECYTHETRRPATWQDELAAFWGAVERDVGVARIFTEPHEPTVEEGYTDFLTRLGYAPDPQYPRWWSKNR